MSTKKSIGPVRSLFVWLMISGVFGAALPPSCWSATFRAGAATADVTPQLGVSMDGGISKPGPVKGVHDPLHARALVLSQGQVTVAVVELPAMVTSSL